MPKSPARKKPLPDSRFPRLYGTGLIHFSVCVCLGSGDALPELSKRAADPNDIVTARLSRSEFAICWFHGKKRVFFHVDVVSKSFLGGSLPPAKGSIRAAEKMLQSVIGKSGKTVILGTMRTKIEDLPAGGIIRVTSPAEEAPGMPVSMRLVGGKVAIKGTPFERLEWMLCEDEKNADITLVSRREMEIKDDHLTKSFEFLRSGFDVLILDKESGYAGK